MSKIEKKTDETGIKIPEACPKCKWSSESSIKYAKIRCKKKNAVVIKDDNGWICYSYSSKNARCNIEYVIKW